MNGVGLITVGRLLGHRRRETTVIYAHLDDGAWRDAAVQAAAVIVHAMGYRTEAPPVPEEQGGGNSDSAENRGDADLSSAGDPPALVADLFARCTTVKRPARPDKTGPHDNTEDPPRSPGISWL